ncbi:hypothetical protein HMPREF9336_00904 [Segniliparus rugosus ATCC BAA-974]|uniref:DUF3090 domain-containing protein n=1 Tax=Segniliparus rugosus (strain ATCC BAA-974 / DSM 45345 / CCUG 50838 / CIP 108380 / JCM 13579 / CDC 945) TaxID=679197 RepID=E5XN34_SEGRC|nr:DUF3090 domain-containing protein [Segniliparus rugosus]EFV14241.2 hypothetical protein HMPREF9336_00904 [Segniliparus rugosus ATCC BAA-974]
MARAIHVFRGPERFITGTVGEPGDRAFFIQVVDSVQVITVSLEKQQVQVLADRVESLLDEVARRFGAPVPPPVTEVADLNPLVTPIETEFRVGVMGLGWDAQSATVVVELMAITEGELDESMILEDSEEGPDAVRVFLSPQAAREFVARSGLVISAGRRTCPLCSEPLDPAGHICPRSNGYHRRTG